MKLSEFDRGGQRGKKRVYLTHQSVVTKQQKCFFGRPCNLGRPWITQPGPLVLGWCLLSAQRWNTEQNSCPLSAPRTPSQILCLPTISSLQQCLGFCSYSLHLLHAPQFLLSPPNQVSPLTFFFFFSSRDSVLWRTSSSEVLISPGLQRALPLLSNLKWLRHKSPLSISLIAHYPLNP